MVAQHTGGYSAQVCCRCKIPVFKELAGAQARPCAADLSSRNGTSGKERDSAGAVVRSACSVHADGSAKLRQGKDDRALPAFAQTFTQGPNPAIKLGEGASQSPKLSGMGVPASDFQCGDPGAIGGGQHLPRGG